MTGRTKSERAALDRLADALVEDILLTPDAVLLAEADNEAGEVAARAAFDRAVARSDRRWPAPAAGRPRRLRQKRGNVRALDPETARLRLEEFIAQYPEAAGKLGAAADKDGRLSDEDVYGILERLHERDAFERREGRRDGR